MIDKVEQFVLSLKGWTYKGILNNVYHGPYKLGYNGDIEGSVLRMCIPQGDIKTKEHKDGRTILFLTDRTYYVLGTKLMGGQTND